MTGGGRAAGAQLRAAGAAGPGRPRPEENAAGSASARRAGSDVRRTERGSGGKEAVRRVAIATPRCYNDAAPPAVPSVLLYNPPKNQTVPRNFEKSIICFIFYFFFYLNKENSFIWKELIQSHI